MIPAAHTGSQDVPNLKSRPTFLEHCRLGGDREPGSSCPESALELGPASRVTRHMVTLSTRAAARSSDSRARSLGAFVSAQMAPGRCQDVAGAQLSGEVRARGRPSPVDAASVYPGRQRVRARPPCVHTRAPTCTCACVWAGHTLSRTERALQRVQCGPQTLLASGPRGPLGGRQTTGASPAAHLGSGTTGAWVCSLGCGTNRTVLLLQSNWPCSVHL